jgi:hypothetical protein
MEHIMVETSRRVKPFISWSRSERKKKEEEAGAS